MARKPKKPTDGWAFTDHVCRNCFGRIMERRDVTTETYRCTNCGAEGEGDVKSICACGSRHTGSRGRAGATLGLRCKPNPNRSLTSPAEIVAMER